MIAKIGSLEGKWKMERLSLIKDRYQRLVVRPRQQLERALVDAVEEDAGFSDEDN